MTSHSLYHNVHLSPCPAQPAMRTDRERNAGELVGTLVEHLIRRLLSDYLPLKAERMLTWQQPATHGSSVWLQRELDVVAGLDRQTLLLCEIKLTTPRKMASGTGQEQLQTATQILQSAQPVRHVLRRLVYVGEEATCNISDWPSVSLQDMTRPTGIIWFTPATIEKAALSQGIQLPHSWQDPTYRSRSLSPVEWRSYADLLVTSKSFEPPVEYARSRNDSYYAPYRLAC